MKDRLHRLMLSKARITEVEQLGPRMRRLRLGGSALYGLDWTPGQHVRLQLRTPDNKPGPVRTYSVWAYNGTALDLIVFDHGDAPGAVWSRYVEEGDEVRVGKPEGKLVVNPGPYHLFIGEETASVAFGPMLRSLPAGSPVYGVVEVDSPDDQLDSRAPAAPAWQYRGGAPAASSGSLLAAVRDLPLPQDPGVAYIAGEAKTVQAVRRHLVEDRRWPRRAVLAKPFWLPGRAGLD